MSLGGGVGFTCPPPASNASPVRHRQAEGMPGWQVNPTPTTLDIVLNMDWM